LEKIQAIESDRVVIERTERNSGVGGATTKGLAAGLRMGGDLFVKVDGDGQMDPARMKDLLMPLLNGFDYAKGNRFLHTEELKEMPTVRLFGNYVLTFMTKLASGYWDIFDPQNGYLAIKRSALEAIPLENLHKRYFFENDLLVNLNINGCRVCDIRMPARYGDEESSLKIWKTALTFPVLLFSRFLGRIYHKHILRDFAEEGLFYIVGLLLMAFGTLFGSYHWVLSILSGTPATTGTVMISVLPIILGFQLFLQAIVLEIQGMKKIPDRHDYNRDTAGLDTEQVSRRSSMAG
ncbi:MAG: glycosyltransferase family 2 protein, partial [Desulfomonilia bacterium]